MALLSVVLLSSCVEPRNRSTSSSSVVSNSKSSVSPGYGRVLTYNPIVLSGNASLSQDYDLGKLLSKPVAITTRTTLSKDCTWQVDCLIVTEDENIEPFVNSDTRWAYPVLSSEFLQINVFHHISKMMNKFFGNLSGLLSSGFVTPYLDPTDPNSPYPSSLPESLFTRSAAVRQGTGLTAYADCGVQDNAYYDSGLFVLCFGYDSIYSDRVKFAQDASIIYHEYGHTVVDLMMNMRNAAAHYDTNPTETFNNRSSLGYSSYDEGGALNEGIADFFSYFMTSRTHFGEWAAGRFNDASRPMKEDDPLHAAGLSPDETGRLSYPDYLTYNPNSPTSKFEDIHYAGQIISHYLTALTEDLVDKCSLTQAASLNAVSHILNETLSELGDLTSTGNESLNGTVNYTINMNPALSKEWLRSVNPITFRKISQYIAKYLKNIYVVNSNYACPSGNYTTDDIESLLDQYGLLLFRSYNDNGNGVAPPWASGITKVNALNRKKSELLSKSLLQLESRATYSKYTIFDDQQTIIDIIEGMASSNQIEINTISTLTPANFGYNNGNGKISPGEVVGVFVNLYNDSNSTMGGVRVLANDWAYMQDSKPCSNLSDAFPSATQGGVTCTPTTSTNFSDGGRLMPVCMLEYNDGTSTKTLSQTAWFEKMKTDNGLLAKDCLDSTDTSTCMFRAIKGADYQNLSKIDPKSNWLESTKDANGDPRFTRGNLIYFEVNKNIPYGTKVICKLRTTFTNCDDCNHDQSITIPSLVGDDYSDWKYATEEPFNIISLIFEIAE